MSDDLFCITMLALLIPALFGMLYLVAGVVLEEFRDGRRRVGLAMIATLAVIVGTALPWWML